MPINHFILLARAERQCFPLQRIEAALIEFFEYGYLHADLDIECSRIAIVAVIVSDEACSHHFGYWVISLVV